MSPPWRVTDTSITMPTLEQQRDMDRYLKSCEELLERMQKHVCIVQAYAEGRKTTLELGLSNHVLHREIKGLTASSINLFNKM